MFDAWLVIIGLMLVAGIVLRIWQRELPPVELYKVSPRAASQLISEFIESSYDGEFGYPSGRFAIISATDSEVVAQEIVGRGSHFTTILKGIYIGIFALGGEFGCVGSLVAIFFAVLLTPALVYAAVTEAILKYLLRSRIVSHLERTADGTKADFTLRGPVALLVGRRLEAAFHAPALPARVVALAGVSPAVSPALESAKATTGYDGGSPDPSPVP